MPDYVLIDGDEVKFEREFGDAIVTVSLGKIRGSGPATVGGKKVCVQGDESRVKVEGCPYARPPFVNGAGTLEIETLSADQVATKTTTGREPMLLVGGRFTARFEVTTPAMNAQGQSRPGEPKSYSGFGTFHTNNTKFRGT